MRVLNMADIGYDIFDPKPDITKQLFKTKKSSSSTRREYLRRREEASLKQKEDTAGLIEPDTNSQHRHSLAEAEDIIKVQESEPEVMSFPFVDATDQVDANAMKDNKALEVKEHPGHNQGAKVCMLSAVIHMKCMLHKKAKSIKQLRKNPKTSLEEKKLLERLEQGEDDSDEEDTGPLAYLKGCRYLRGVKEDKELTIEDIFS